METQRDASRPVRVQEVWLQVCKMHAGSLRLEVGLVQNGLSRRIDLRVEVRLVFVFVLAGEGGGYGCYKVERVGPHVDVRFGHMVQGRTTSVGSVVLILTPRDRTAIHVCAVDNVARRV